jgi:hypothetical protein
MIKTARVVIRAHLLQMLSVLGAAADELSPQGKIELSTSSEPTSSAMALIQRSARGRTKGGSDGVGDTSFIEILRNLPAATKSMTFYIVRQTRNRFGSTNFANERLRMEQGRRGFLPCFTLQPVSSAGWRAEVVG